MAHVIPGGEIAGVVTIESGDGTIVYNQPDGYVIGNVGIIDTPNIKAGAVGTTQILAGAVTGGAGGSIGLGAVTNYNMAGGSIAAVNVITGTLTNNCYANESVDARVLKPDLSGDPSTAFDSFFYFDYISAEFPMGSACQLIWAWADNAVSGNGGYQNINPGPSGSTGQGSFYDFPNSIVSRQPSNTYPQGATTYDSYFVSSVWTVPIGGLYHIILKIDADLDQSNGGLAFVKGGGVILRQTVMKSGERSMKDSFYVNLELGDTLVLAGDYAYPGAYSFPANVIVRKRYLQIYCIQPRDWGLGFGAGMGPVAPPP